MHDALILSSLNYSGAYSQAAGDCSCLTLVFFRYNYGVYSFICSHFIPKMKILILYIKEKG